MLSQVAMNDFGGPGGDFIESIAPVIAIIISMAVAFGISEWLLGPDSLFIGLLAVILWPFLYAAFCLVMLLLAGLAIALLCGPFLIINLVFRKKNASDV